MKKNINNQRRQLVNAVWAVPAVQLIALPSHAQATSIAGTEGPVPCSENGTSSWELIESSTVRLNGGPAISIIIAETTQILEITINDNVYSQKIMSVGKAVFSDGVIRDFRGNTESTGTYNRSTNTVTIDTCVLAPGFLRYECGSIREFQLTCGDNQITTISQTIIGDVFTDTYRRL